MNQLMLFFRLLLKPGYMFSVLFLICSVFSASGQNRYYFDYCHKRIFKDKPDSGEVFSPINFPADKDIKFEIYNYNPLKDEISVDETSSDWFQSDTSKLSKYIVLPNVQGLIGNKAAGSNNPDSVIATWAKEKKKTDCDVLSIYFTEFNDLQQHASENIVAYKTLVSKIEIIEDVYENLKNLPALNPNEVKAQLENNFIAILNAFTDLDNRLDPIAVHVSARQIMEIEEHYFNDILQSAKDLADLKTEVDQLKGENCKEFATLYKNFMNAFSPLKSSLEQLTEKRTEKIIPELTKTTFLFEKLKAYINTPPLFVTKNVTIEKDEHSILIYNKPIENGAQRQLYETIKVLPKGGWRVDLSAGIFASGLYDAAYTKKSKDSIYTKQYVSHGAIRDTTVSETFSSLYEKKQAHVSFGGMLYVNAHTHLQKYLNYGFYVGFGALFNDQTRWSGAAGGSLITGKKQRFSVHLGVVIAQVDRLNPPYTTEKWTTDPIDNIPLSKFWKYNWMVGFSWKIK